MPIVYLGIGSNIKPEIHLSLALELLKSEVKVLAISSHYRTAPLAERVEQEDYINGVWKISSDLSYDELKDDVLHPIEEDCGRERSEDKYASRPIDIDIILWGDEVCQGLLPDPDLFTREFLAFPLLELAPAIILPGETEAFREQVGFMEPPQHLDKEITALLQQGI